MPEPGHQNIAVLALFADARTMQPLVDQLRRAGIAVDAVKDLRSARTSFFGAGGHDCVVVAPDVRPGVAQSVASSLGAIDPGLAFVSFGPDLGERHPRSVRLGSYHPASRAGQGALLRFLRTL